MIIKYRFNLFPDLPLSSEGITIIAFVQLLVCGSVLGHRCCKDCLVKDLQIEVSAALWRLDGHEGLILVPGMADEVDMLVMFE